MPQGRGMLTGKSAEVVVEAEVEKDTTVTITDGMAAGVFGSGI